MKVLYEETYEREGNDSWLIDKIQIIREDGDLVLRHKIKHNGWNGENKETREIDLEKYDSVEDKQLRVAEYMGNELLTPEMKIPDLNEILNDGEY